MLLQLSDAELKVLEDVLRRAMGDLREEIYKTEAAEYQAQLHKREVVLDGLLTKMAGSIAAIGAD
jgi:hypothetical protein